jgi:hypothetical protein
MGVSSFRRSWRQQVLHAVGLILGVQVSDGNAVMGKIKRWVPNTIAQAEADLALKRQLGLGGQANLEDWIRRQA